MDILRTILTIIFIIDCVALVVIVMMQQGKGQGLGALAGSMPTAETHWGEEQRPLQGREP